MSQDEETKRKIWARRVADRIVDGALTVGERLPEEDRNALLREIARRALWHMPNSNDELKALRNFFKNLRPPCASLRPSGGLNLVREQLTPTR
jgi:hypothetical protein